MTRWLSGTRGAALVLVLWVVGWGLGFGGLIELLVDPHGEYLDIWPAAMALPGFIGGLVFAGLLSIARNRPRFDQMSVARFVALGALTGLLLGGLAVGSGASRNTESVSLAPAEAVAILGGLGVVAAVGTLVFFRLVTWRRPAVRARRTG